LICTYHVLSINEGVVDSHNLDVITLKRRAHDEASNAAEALEVS